MVGPERASADQPHPNCNGILFFRRPCPESMHPTVRSSEATLRCRIDTPPDPPEPGFFLPLGSRDNEFHHCRRFLLHGWSRRGLDFFAVALLVAFSRVYIGPHCVSDVLGGAVTAMLAAARVLLFNREGSRLDGLLTRIWHSPIFRRLRFQ